MEKLLEEINEVRKRRGVEVDPETQTAWMRLLVEEFQDLLSAGYEINPHNTNIPKIRYHLEDFLVRHKADKNRGPFVKEALDMLFVLLNTLMSMGVPIAKVWEQYLEHTKFGTNGSYVDKHGAAIRSNQDILEIENIVAKVAAKKKGKPRNVR